MPTKILVKLKDGQVDSREPPKHLTLEQAIGQVLRNERLDRGLKQIDVAVATNFGVRSIRTMEYGKQSMTIRSLDALAMFYELPLEQVIIRAKRLRYSSLKNALDRHRH